MKEANEKLEARIIEQVKIITEAEFSTIFAMSKLSESKDPDASVHFERVREYSRILALYLMEHSVYSKQIDEGFIEALYATAALHDIGKVGIPDSILLKPETLTAKEREIMQRHTVLGANALREVAEKCPYNSLIQMGLEVTESHHERWDGTGYPNGIKGEAIPLAARIVALADVYDVLTSNRCYKNAIEHDQSRLMIAEGRGTQFDPQVVDAFLALEMEFYKIRNNVDDKDRGTLFVQTG